MSFSIAQLVQLASSVGFPDPATAAAVAMAESGGDSNALGDTQITPGGSVGLWQVNLAAHPQYDAGELYDPTTNAQAALSISSGGTNWRPWSTYTSGAYLHYLPAAQAVVPTPTWEKVGGLALALGAVAASFKVWPSWPLRLVRIAKGIVR